jgi:transcription elongation factor Elf1
MPVEPDRRAAAPLTCPFCASETITATTQKVTVETYWRCEKCGQLWHPQRLRAQWEFRERR